jgi:phenylalanyl-tRNA synthetase alpha subunit
MKQLEVLKKETMESLEERKSLQEGASKDTSLLTSKLSDAKKELDRQTSHVKEASSPAAASIPSSACNPASVHPAFSLLRAVRDSHRDNFHLWSCTKCRIPHNVSW